MNKEGYIALVLIIQLFLSIGGFLVGASYGYEHRIDLVIEIHEQGHIYQASKYNTRYVRARKNRVDVWYKTEDQYVKMLKGGVEMIWAVGYSTFIIFFLITSTLRRKRKFWEFNGITSLGIGFASGALFAPFKSAKTDFERIAEIERTTLREAWSNHLSGYMAITLITIILYLVWWMVSMVKRTKPLPKPQASRKAPERRRVVSSSQKSGPAVDESRSRQPPR